MAGGIPVLRAGNIGNELELDRNLIWVPSQLISPSQRMRVGDIALCASSGSSTVVGKSALLRRVWNGTVGAFCVLIRPDSTRCIPDFLAFVLRGAEFRRWTTNAAGASIKNIRKSELERFPIVLPPMAEQRRIVDILNRAARIEALRGRATERLQEFVPALFIRMFGDAVENPKGWPTERLGDCCVEVHYGTSKKANDRSEGIPILRMGNVTYDGDLDHTDLKHVLLSDAEIAKYGLREGDILFNRTNSRELVGKTGLWDGRFPAVPASYFVRLRLDESRADPTYVWAAMNSAGMKRRLLAMARGAIGQANINAKELRSIQLPIPPLNLQRRYGETLEGARAIARAGEVGAGTAAALIASLMSELFRNLSPQRCDPSAMARPSAAPAP